MGILTTFITPSVPFTIQKFTSGSGTYNKNYAFIISPGSATIGATYTHNAITYTVYSTVSSSSQIVMSGSAAPLVNGVLTKSSGTGDATITFSQSISPKLLKIKMVGGGAGGGGTNGAGGGTTGGAGGDTTFGTLLTAFGGSGGSGGNTQGGAGGLPPTINSPAISIVSVAGGNGGPSTSSGSVNGGSGSNGGVSPFGGAGAASFTGTQDGHNAIDNTGSGGGGVGISGGFTIGSSAGGAGSYLEALILSPAATYLYAIGSGGSGGVSTRNGGSGGEGILIAEEHY